MIDEPALDFALPDRDGHIAPWSAPAGSLDE